MNLVGRSGREHGVEIAAGKPEAVLEIAKQFLGTEWRKYMPQPESLLQAGECRRIQLRIQFRITHQYYVGAVRYAGVCRCQRLELRQCVRADTHCVLDHDDDPGLLVSELFEQAPEHRESLHGALGQVLDAQFLEQKFENLVVPELDASYRDYNPLGTHTVQGPANDGGLAAADLTNDCHDRVCGRQPLLHARQRGGALRANEHVVAEREGSKRPFLQAKVGLVHASRSS